MLEVIEPNLENVSDGESVWKKHPKDVRVINAKRFLQNLILQVYVCILFGHNFNC